MDFTIGDFLFGYPIVELSSDYVTVNLGGDTHIQFDGKQFNEGVRQTMRELGVWVLQA